MGKRYNHNKLNLIPGDIVVLDKGFRNSSRVRVVQMTPSEMFSRVHSAELENPTDEDCWDVMINRLSKVEND